MTVLDRAPEQTEPLPNPSETPDGVVVERQFGYVPDIRGAGVGEFVLGLEGRSPYTVASRRERIGKRAHIMRGSRLVSRTVQIQSLDVAT